MFQSKPRRLFLQTHHDRYVRAKSDETLDQASHKRSDELFRMTFHGPRVRLRSRFGTYVTVDEDEETVKLIEDKTDFGLFSLVSNSGGTHSFLSPQTERYLRAANADENFKVNQAPHNQEWERFRLEFLDPPFPIWEPWDRSFWDTKNAPLWLYVIILGLGLIAAAVASFIAFLL